MKNEGQGFYSGNMAADIDGRWLVTIEDPEGHWRLYGEWISDADQPLRLLAKK